jgi:hypothetical protein
MNTKHFARLSSILMAGFALMATGCWNGGLPAELPVALPDGSAVIAPANAGASRLASSSWTIYADPNDPVLLFRLDFGAEGQVVRMFENHVYPELIGDELIPDAQMHPSPWPGGTYAGQFYGVGQEPHVGYAALARAFLGPLTVGTGNFQFSGTLVGDHIEGTLDFWLEIDPAIASLLPFPPGDYHADVIALPAGVEPPSRPRDSFEPDDDMTSAKPIQIGDRQTHSIVPATDEDWISFEVTGPANIVIETFNTTGDTVIWLYDQNLYELANNDDYFGQMSRLEMQNLPSGRYYILVHQYDRSQTIAAYDIQVVQY